MIVVMPMAGRGSRMADGGYAQPKPLISVAGQPMFAWALRSLENIAYQRLVVVALAEHEAHYQVTEAVHRYAEADVVLLEEVTQGQLCTVLAARHLIDPDADLLITSSDTYIVSGLGAEIAQRSATLRGLISVAHMPGDQWSFARLDTEGRVVEVAEKVRISDYASTGLYYFSRGGEFLEAADEIVAAQEKTRGEYYVMPVYERYIRQGWEVRVSLASEMWDMGTPDALRRFRKHLA